MKTMTRMGAGCAYIECWDVEIFDFIDLKKKNGDERRRAHDLFLGVNVRDFFMQRLSNDSDAMMTLFSPYDVPELRELYGEQFTARYEQYEKEFRTTPERFNKYTKQVKVMDVYKYMMQSWVESGTPFWHFIDTTNKKHAHPQLGVIRQSNLCVRGDTRILTKDYGYVRIGYLVEDGKTELECWNGKEWSMTKLMKTSDNSNLLTVKLSNRQDIYATPYHKWYRIASDGSSVEKVTTEELQPGDKLCNFDLDIVQHGNKILPHPYTNGYLALDRDGDHRRIEIELWDEEEIKLAENLTGYVSTTDIYGFRGVDKNLSNDGELVFRYGTYTDEEDLTERTSSLTDEDYGIPVKVLFYKKEDLLTQYTVPSSEYMLEDRLEWLAGLLDKCGDRGIDNGEDIISLKHHDMRFLKEVSLLLQELGIHSRFEDVKPTKTTQHYSPTLTNCFSSGTKLEYAKLIISLDKLLNIGVPFKVIQSVLVYVPDDSERPVSYITVESVTDEGVTAPTYCGTEPKEHKLMFNGVLTGNCTEVLQPTDEEHTAICNLGSLNVSRYVDEETLKKTIKIAVRALDNAIDLTVYPSKKAELTQKERRSIGLGALGEAEYVARHNMYYGSDEHKQFIDRFYKVMSDTVHETTKELSKEKGSCIVEGVRNAYLMCIAPNSTSGSFAGTTNSTEPVYSELWIEGNKDNEYYVTAPNITKENRKYYESAFVIDPIKQIECTAIRQKYIDMAISTNVHMNNIGLKASNIDKVVKKAWSEGLKTLYYFKTKAVKTITCVGCEN